MNWLDAVIALIIFAPAYFGYVTGFLRKLFGLIGILLGFVIAVKLINPVSEFFINKIHTNPPLTYVFVFILLILIVYITLIYIAKYIANLHPATNITDKILGVILGFLQGLLLASMFLFNLNFLGFPAQTVKDNSLLYSKVVNIAPKVFDKIISIFPGSKSFYEEYKRIVG